MKEIGKKNWSDLMSEIPPSHKTYWGLFKALKTEGAVPTSALKRLDNSIPFDDWEEAECLADSIKHQCSDNPPYDLEILGGWKRRYPKPGKPRPSYRPISLLSVLGKLFEKTLKTRLSDQLIGKSLIINEQFGFRHYHSCPQQALRLVEYISEGFEVKRKTVAVLFDVAKAFGRVWHAGLIHKLYQLELPDRLVLSIHHYISNRHFSFRLDNTYSSMRSIRAGVSLDFTLSPLLYSAYVNDIPRPSTGVQLALFTDDTALYLRSNSIGNILPRLQRAIDKLAQWLRLWTSILTNQHQAIFITVYIRRAADAPWYVKNSTLHRDLELPTIYKFMKDASERFFNVASNHLNPLLVEAVSYEPPPPHHFCRKPRNVVEVEKLIELNKMVTE
ncbi:Probable RNA-directed DNA polymerase from transposon BS [Eumeta japonica]|uniref:Probable RNA-directed DNA polymerase from transposon BS n=1 Tax=Eumeta variegata TaxID=151549 RepID=A0A4C1UR09_EUMVA|nr:Probable RNA-directed DNA polymerase from transposon BS [Eumeta japonica]